MLQVSNLDLEIPHRGQARQLLTDVNLELDAGQSLAIIGESGSGKTMTALSILRLLPQGACYGANSQILFAGRDLLNISESQMRKTRGAQIGMVFQDPNTSLNPVLTIGKQLTEVLNLHVNLYGRAAYIEALRLLEMVQLSNPVRQYNAYPHELSGGMKQRVALAIALACRPSLLIADEPTTALDVTVQAEILKLLQMLQREQNLALLLITHNLSIAMQLTEHIVVMRRGRVVETGATKEFFTLAQDEYSRELLASIQDLVPKMPEVATSTDTIMQINDLQVKYPIKAGLLRRIVGYHCAVDKVTLQLYPGQTLAIIGESGCGKTSLAKALVGINLHASGVAEYQGNNLLEFNAAGWRKVRSDIQFIFQDPYSALDPKLPVWHSLLEGIINLMPNYVLAHEQARLIQFLQDVGLDSDCIYKYPHQFSGGERQRLCIVRALMLSPKILICDEPTSSLDVSVQAMVLNLLAKLQEQYQISYLLITHDFGVVARLAHQVAVMQRGQIVEYAAVRQVLFAPQDSYTRKLIAGCGGALV